MRQEEVNLMDTICRHIHETVKQICGGAIEHEEDQNLQKLIPKSITLSIQKNNGKPHDIELRIALSLYHKWKRSSKLTVISDFGIARQISTPRQLAELLCNPLEEAFREDGIAHDVRVKPSGIICIVTYEQSERLRKAGKLPCPHCTQWCKGTKGLWWHQQQKHVVEYSQATAVASSSINELAIVPYDPNFNPLMKEDKHVKSTPPARTCISVDPFDFCKEGNLCKLKQAVQNGFVPATVMDQRGAAPLHWAAGSGHLHLVKYLIEECECDPNQTQQGKRSFSGRTSLHWAARNGHFEVVEYLVCDCCVDLEASTIDGTTAICWAAWQGHLKIMEFLCRKGCNIRAVNSFGCNAALWCAQGKGSIETFEWLWTNQCPLTTINNNGHGVVHKTAQRGWREGCEWFCAKIVEQAGNNSLSLVGPDTEGYCPSDLAGMEGHEELGRWLAILEMNLVQKLSTLVKLPMWLTEPINNLGISTRVSGKDQFTWERYGGLRRMRSTRKRKTYENIVVN